MMENHLYPHRCLRQIVCQLPCNPGLLQLMMKKKTDTDHQQRMMVKDSETSVQQSIPNCLSLGHNTLNTLEKSSASRVTSSNAVALSSEVHSDPVPHSLYVSGAPKDLPHQLEDRTSDRVIDVQSSHDSNSTAEIRKTKEMIHDVQISYDFAATLK